MHSWKQKFVLMTSATFVERIQPKEVTLDPKPEVLACLNSREKSLYESFKSSGKRPNLSWHLLIQLETLEEHGLVAVKHPGWRRFLGLWRIYMVCYGMKWYVEVSPSANEILYRVAAQCFMQQ
ncbi:hypothetical protein Dimus_036456 [Dionaea muscipula]